MSKKEKILLKLLFGNADNNFDLDDLIHILIRFKKEKQEVVIEFSQKKILKEL
jgi:hypothetical protein